VIVAINTAGDAGFAGRFIGCGTRCIFAGVAGHTSGRSEVPPSAATLGNRPAIEPQLCGSQLRSRHHEVENSGASFNQDSDLSVRPHNVACAPRFRHQFLHCVGRNRLRGHNCLVIFQPVVRRGIRSGEHANGAHLVSWQVDYRCVDPHTVGVGRVILNGSIVPFSPI
jgi:hypothetical protein